MAYESKLESLDKERGDLLIIERDAAALIKGCGAEIGGPIAFTFIQWFMGKPGDEPPTMPDPRDNGILAMLIEKQKERVEKYVKHLKNQQEKGLKSAAARAAKQSTESNHGQPRSTKEEREKEMEVERENPVRIDFPLSTTSNLPPNKLGHAGDAPAHAATGDGLNAAPCGTRTATRVAYIDPEWGSQIDARTFDEAELRARPVSFMLAAIGEEGDQRTRNALTKAVEELGPDTFAETCWRFVADMVQAENAYAAAATKVRDNFAKKYGDEADAKLSAVLKKIATNGSTNRANDWFVIPWQKWRDFQPGRFLMSAIKEAKLAAGIPTKRKPKRKGGDE